MLDMTPLGWQGRKASTQTNKRLFDLRLFLSVSSSLGVMEGLRFVIVALLWLFSFLFLPNIHKNTSIKEKWQDADDIILDHKVPTDLKFRPIVAGQACEPID